MGCLEDSSSAGPEIAYDGMEINELTHNVPLILRIISLEQSAVRLLLFQLELLFKHGRLRLEYGKGLFKLEAINTQQRVTGQYQIYRP